MRLTVWLMAIVLGLGQTSNAPSRLRMLAESIPGSVPAEFAADLLIRLADSAAAAKEDADWREAIYQQAFEIAGSAQDPLPGIPAKGRTLDLQTDIKYKASRMLGLDTLSLRVRAIQGLQEFRLTHAIELIQRLDTRVAALTCHDALVPNPTAMFDVGRLLPFDAFEQQIASVRSSTEVSPALQSVLETNVSDEQSQRLLLSLANTLRGLNDDDATFSASAEAIWAAVKRAVDRVDDATVVGALLDAFREYVVRHLTAARCARPGTKPESFGPTDSSAVADINTVLVAHDRAALSRRELTPVRLIDIEPSAPFAPSEAAKAVTVELTALETLVMMDPPAIRRPRTLEERASLDLREPIARLQTAMARWTARDERSAAEYFHARRLALLQVVALLPPGVDRDQAIADVLAFMKSEGIERYGHVEWFYPVRQLLNGHKESATERDWMLRTLLDSGDPVMRLYAQVEEFLGLP